MEPLAAGRRSPGRNTRRKTMNSIIYIVGLVVIVIAILSFLGLS
ncbi:conserved hypothetical protein [Rhizobium sp. EC-SD404]|nr:conserved hypothetical protein [Rhizobium sp. EC-SD404]